MTGRAIEIAGRGWRQLAVPCALLVLVTGLGALQYRWVGQIADGERQRMQASVQARTNQFADELDREATALFASFSQFSRPAVDDVGYEAFFAREYARWAATSAHARLVRALFLVLQRDGATTIEKLEAGTFRAVDWPPELGALRKEFDATPAADKVRWLLPQFDARMPALLIPVPRLQVTDIASTPGRVRMMNVAGIAGRLVVQLDRDYFRHAWLPALARRYFASSDGFDYNLAVVDSVSRSFLYVSDPALTMAAFARPDAKAGIFQVRPERMERTMVERTLPAAGGRESVRLSVATVQGSRAIVYGRARAGAAEWQLVLAHRAGSLEAAIARSRHRNLAISFGILALLAVSLGLMVLSSRRASYLARQQVEFVAGVSHELRTPLSVICSAAENLSDGVIVDGPQVKRYGQLIVTEGRRLTEMVEQVMAFAGLHAGRDLAGRETIAIEEVIDVALQACAPAIEERGAEVAKSVPSNLPRVHVNAGALRRCLQNLLDNAIKYGGEHPSIRVSADLDRGGDGVAITVEDRGLGIRPEEQRRIFEPFFRGRDVAASPMHGSGLGLSLVRRIVEAHGGRVTVRSSPGLGSAFTIHLPAAPRSRESASAAGEQEQAG